MQTALHHHRASEVSKVHNQHYTAAWHMPPQHTFTSNSTISANRLRTYKLKHQNLNAAHYGKLWEMSVGRQQSYPHRSSELKVISSHILYMPCKLSKLCILVSYQYRNSKQTFVSFSFCDPNDINHFIRPKHLRYRDWFLKMFTSPLHLLFNGATIKLNFHDVCLLLTFLQQLHLIQATLLHIFILSITCFVYIVSN